MISFHQTQKWRRSEASRYSVPFPPSPEEGGDDDHPLFAILPCSIRAESDNTCTYWLRIALAHVKWQVDLGVDTYRNHQARGIYEYQTQTFWVVLKQRIDSSYIHFSRLLILMTIGTVKLTLLLREFIQPSVDVGLWFTQLFDSVLLVNFEGCHVFYHRALTISILLVLPPESFIYPKMSKK